ncbi:MAG: PilZ domain-containing protein [Desulfuromonadales bacterium]|jgi:Tfp pilus assembly protein PilZ
MKTILVADQRDDLLATLEPILKHWGYRVLSTQKASQVTTFLKESNPCMLMIGEKLLDEKNLVLEESQLKRIRTGQLPSVALKQGNEGRTELIPEPPLDVPLDIFDLYAFIQGRVEKFPRQNLRLRLRLPGMYRVTAGEYIFADVINLSIAGLFFKAATKVQKGDRISVVFPLFGRGREIEVESTVLFTVEPEAGNNYFQGFGVGFDALQDNQYAQLRDYIKEHFLREVAASKNGVGDFAKGQLKD